jgi:hypothetical protein
VIRPNSAATMLTDLATNVDLVVVCQDSGRLH